MKKAWILISLVIFTSCSMDNNRIQNENLETTLIDELKSSLTTNNPNSTSDENEPTTEIKEAISIINEEGKTIEKRFNTPDGFERIKVEDGSYGQYLRTFQLKPNGSKVHYYNGDVKPWDVHEAVLDIDVGEKDLQQCADAVMRLRAEYLYGKGLYNKIHFNFTNGFKADYSNWMQGNRIAVSGNKVHWVKRSGYSKEYSSFRDYLDMVFSYAGTLSLSREMQKTTIEEMRIGDVFLKGGTPGHCVIIMDMAENKETGEKLFMLAQSYMPAQEIHVLKNPENTDLSPWYSVEFDDTLNTPEWQFSRDQLYRFKD